MSYENKKIMTLEDGQLLLSTIDKNVRSNKANTDSVSVLKEISGGSVVTVPDGIPEKVKIIDIEIAPKQDLHGYEKPWIGGAGRNMLKLASSYEERYGITYAPNPATGEIVIDGTAESLAQVTLCNIDLTNVATGTTLYINGMSNNSDCRTIIEYLDGGSVAIRSIPDTGDYMIVPEGATYVKVSVGITQGITVNNAIMKPFVAKSETALPFEPYENICPISGWTKCNVIRTGKNLSNSSSFVSGWIINTSGFTENNSDHTAQVSFIPVKPSTTYTLSGKGMHTRPSSSSSTSNAFVNVAEYATRNAQSFLLRPVNSQSSDNSYTFTTSEKTYFVRFSVSVLATNVQFELGSVATPYTEYTGNNDYSITLPDEAGTVYGGELSIHRDGVGMLEVDRKVLNITGENVTATLNGGVGFYRAVLTIPDDSIVSNDGNILTGKLLSDQYVEITNTAGNQGGTGLTYRGNGSHSIILSNPQVNSSSVADWQNWIDSHPFTIVYGLEITSFYSQFPTPAVEMVFGTNNIFSDTGEIKQITYPAERYLPAEQAEKERIHITVDEPSDVISINDGSDNVPMALKIGIEPAQDKHGYDYPWAGGCGKNLLNSDMLVDDQFVKNADGTYIFTKQGSTTADRATAGAPLVLEVGKSYRLSMFVSGTLSEGTDLRYRISENDTYQSGRVLAESGVVNQRVSLSILFSNTTDKLQLYFGGTSSAGIGDSLTISDIMVEEGTTDTDYEPYSNICPISGWAGCNITQTGKNLLRYPYHNTTLTKNGITFTDNGDGSITLNGTSTAQTDFQIIATTKVHPLRNGNYKVTFEYVSGDVDSASTSACYLHIKGDASEASYTNFKALDPPNVKSAAVINNKFYYMTIRCNLANVTFSNYRVRPMIVMENETDFTYEPYKNAIYSVRFPSEAGTVYGGELTVNKDGTGELAVNRKQIIIDGTNVVFSEAFQTAAQYKNITFGINAPDAKRPLNADTPSNVISDNFKTVLGSAALSQSDEIYGVAIVSQASGSSRRIRITIPKSLGVLSLANANAWVQEIGGITVVYELETPLSSIPLTASQVRSLLGINNIFADTGKINEVQYSADTKEYIDNADSELREDVDALQEQTEELYEATDSLKVNKADIINVTDDAPEDIKMILDGANDLPMALKVAVEPVQDLHGFENPWPAGGGKNLYNKDDTSLYKNNTYLEPTTGTTKEMVNDIRCVIVPCDALKTYTISNGVKTTIRVASFTSNPPLNTNPTAANSPEGQTEADVGLSITTGASDAYLVIQVMANTDVSGGMTLENAIAKLMVEEGSTASAWQPYSNICPISGWTGCNVTRTGENLFDDAQTPYSANSNINSSGEIGSNNNYDVYKLVLPAGNYVASEITTATANNQSIRIATYTKTGGMIDYYEQSRNGAGVMAKAFSVGDTAAYVLVMIRKNCQNPYVVIGENETEYEPYAGEEYAITFPSSAGTVYGGTLTVNKDGTGTLVMNWNKLVVTNSDTLQASGKSDDGSYAIYKKTLSTANKAYQATPNDGDQYGLFSQGKWMKAPYGADRAYAYSKTEIRVSLLSFDPDVDMSTSAGRQAYFDNLASENIAVEVCYKLETPQTYELSALEVIETLKGINNIFADTGDILSVDYSADTKMYVDAGESKQEQINLTRDMIAYTEPDASTRNYPAWSMMIHNDALYQATESISIGEKLIENQNIKEASLNSILGLTYRESVAQPYETMQGDSFMDIVTIDRVGRLRMVNAMVSPHFFTTGTLLSGKDAPAFYSELYFPVRYIYTENDQTITESCTLKYTKSTMKWELIRNDGTTVNPTNLGLHDKIHFYAIWFV